jgi:hypothetical protein
VDGDTFTTSEPKLRKNSSPPSLQFIRDAPRRHDLRPLGENRDPRGWILRAQVRFWVPRPGIRIKTRSDATAKTKTT